MQPARERARADVVDHRHAQLAQRLDADVLDEPELAEVGLVHAQHRAGVRRERALVVGQPRAVGRPDLDEPRARLGDHVGHAEAAADLDELPARDHDLRPGPASAAVASSAAPAPLLTASPASAPVSSRSSALDVGVPGAARAGLEVAARGSRSPPRPARPPRAPPRPAARARGSCGRSRRSR